MSTLILTRQDVSRLVEMRDVISVVEQGFRDHASGNALMKPKTYLNVDNGDFRAMPGAVPGGAGVKWVNVHPRNHERGLPTVMGVFVYSDPATGYPLAIMDATEITAYRTAATSAVASKHMARADSRVLGLVGAGCQARMHIESHRQLFDLKLIKVNDACPEAIEALMHEYPDLTILAASPREVAGSDILCTLTPSRKPIIRDSWVNPGTHINAVGADAPGKQELDPAILSRSRVVVDDVTQACHSGEINVSIRDGLFKCENIWATLGEIVSSSKPAREHQDMITVFDSTGLAIEDVATAHLVYEKAQIRDGFLRVDLV